GGRERPAPTPPADGAEAAPPAGAPAPPPAAVVRDRRPRRTAELVDQRAERHEHRLDRVAGDGGSERVERPAVGGADAGEEAAEAERERGRQEAQGHVALGGGHEPDRRHEAAPADRDPLEAPHGDGDSAVRLTAGHATLAKQLSREDSPCSETSHGRTS